MPQTITPTLDDVNTALRSFLLSIVPAGTEVFKAAQNRAGAPLPSNGYVTFMEMFDKRLRTSIDSYDFTAVNPTTLTVEQGIELTYQLDFFGPLGGNWAAMVTTLLRDDYGAQALAPAAQPLYCDDARRDPTYVNDEGQYEGRWIVTAALQWNPQVTPTQQFANTLGPVGIVDVDAIIPP
jgi:hypothetical protein